VPRACARSCVRDNTCPRWLVEMALGVFVENLFPVLRLRPQLASLVPNASSATKHTVPGKKEEEVNASLLTSDFWNFEYNVKV
jgi:hypothetical protein